MRSCTTKRARQRGLLYSLLLPLLLLPPPPLLPTPPLLPLPGPRPSS